MNPRHETPCGFFQRGQPCPQGVVCPYLHGDHCPLKVAEAEQHETLHDQIEEFYNGDEAELWLPALDANSR